MSTIKFFKHYVTNGTVKARVFYSHYNMVSTGEECVALYAKDYGSTLRRIFDNAENDSESNTDYFETDRVRILKGNPLFCAALARCHI